MQCIGCVRIEERNADFLIVDKKGGAATQVFRRLREFLKKNSGGTDIAYVTARWAKPAACAKNVKGYVLLLDLCKSMAPPKPLW